MPISQVLDLRCSLAHQAVVSLAQITLPVFPLTVEDSKNGEKADANLATQVDCVADWVPWRILGSICPAIVLVFNLVRFCAKENR